MTWRGEKARGDWLTGELRSSAPSAVVRAYFKGVLTWVGRNNGQGWLKTKINLSLKKLPAWGVTTHLTGPVRNF